MAKTEYHYLQGKIMWCKHTAPDPWGNWKVTLYPNEESKLKIAELKARGLRNVMKLDDDGENMTFRRPQQKMIRGKVVGLAPPEIVDKNGDKMRDILVGNGSDGTVKLEVYTFDPPTGGPKGLAARWLSLRVDNLVPYDGVKKDFDETQQRAVSGLAEQPEQLF